MYKCYVRQRVREVLAEMDVPASRAIDFLEECEYGIVRDSDGRETTIEELQNVKSVKPDLGTGLSDGDSSGREVPKDPYSELFEFTRDNTE